MPSAAVLAARRVVLLACLLAAGCGGGDAPSDQRHPVAPTLRGTAAAEGVLDADALMDWAQAAFPQHFPGTPPDQAAPPYVYRWYAGSGNYLGVAGYEVALLGALSPDGIRRAGWLPDFACSVFPAQCGATVSVPAASVDQPHYAATAVASAVPVAVVAPQDAAGTPKVSADRFRLPRSYAVTDLDQDGLDDLVVAPSFGDRGPAQELRVWRNRGDGTFADVTRDAFEGAVPQVQAPAAIIAADFNGDRRPDLLVVDQGWQPGACAPTACPGARNVLVLSQPGGRLRDVTATNLPRNTERFHLVASSVGDLDGDGDLDVAVPAAGGAAADGRGVLLWINDGTGVFSERSAALLPAAIAYRLDGFPVTAEAERERQLAGATGFADLDGDGRPELLTCSQGADAADGRRTIRIHRWDPQAGRAAEVHRLPQAPEIAAAAGAGASCAGIAAGDLDGDGLADLVVLWDAGAAQYVQVARGLGPAAGFADATLTALGRHQASYGSPWWLGQAPVFASVPRDINGDGVADLVHLAGRVTTDMLAGASPAAFVNDGHGVLAPQRLRGNSGFYAEWELRALLQVQRSEWLLPLYGRFTAAAAATPDLLLVRPASDSVVLQVLAARAPAPSVTMFKSLGSVQCWGGGLTLADLQAGLAPAGIGVLSATCGYDGLVYPAVCGAGDGRIGIVEIEAAQAPQAAALGFAPLATLPNATRAPCN